MDATDRRQDATKPLKPKGPSRTAPKNHQRPPLKPVSEDEIEEEFMRGEGTCFEWGSAGNQVAKQSGVVQS
ncbi:hypothetical protein ACM66B_004785 [Microbotryomycetes sp. NB124-2]